MSNAWGRKDQAPSAAGAGASTGASAAAATTVAAAEPASVQNSNNASNAGASLPTVGSEEHGGGRAGTGQGRVKAVLSGDSFVVWVAARPGHAAGAAPEEVQVTLSLLSAPRIARGKDAGVDQPWAWQARESLRKLLQGRTVQYRIDYTHPQSGRHYAFVRTQEGVNVNVAVAASGWARVQDPKAGKGPRGAEHAALLEASARAQETRIGIFSDDAEAAQRSVRDVKEKFDSWKLFEDVKERQPVHGVVEGVLDGTTVRVLLVPSFYSVVVRLAGVQSPIWSRSAAAGGDESARTAQPFAEAAKYLTEYCLLGRDVAVQLAGVNKDDTFYGTVLFAGKNVADELLKSGYARFVQWSAPEGDAARLAALESAAAARGVGLHRAGAGGSASGAASGAASGGGAARGPAAREFAGTVTDVRSGSRLTVQDAAGVQHDVFFSSVIAPKLNPKNAKEDEPCGFEAREHLRKKLIGKAVRVALDYEKAARPDEDGGAGQTRRFYSVYAGGKHVPLQMVEAGLGSVITHRREEPRSREYSALMAAEDAAKKAARGLWAPNAPVTRLLDQSGLRGPQARQYLKFVQKPALAAVVEFVMNPVRLKLFVPELAAFISFSVAAVRAPWAEDAHGDAATRWARAHLHQRKLEVDISAVDKGGNFVGDAYLHKQNVALTLLEEGWAQVATRGAERHPQLALYQRAEAAAQQQRRGLWRDWSPPPADAPDAAAVDAAERPQETGKLLVTELVDGHHFYCQRVADTEQAALDALMAELQRANAASPAAPPPRWAADALACARFADDGLWYRVRLLDAPRDGRCRIHYVDFGNTEVRDERELRALPAPLHGVPAKAILCTLALLRVPTLAQDCGQEAAQALKELTWGKVLMASIEWRAGTEHHVTLGDVASGININKEMVRMGLATVKAHTGRRFEKPIAQLMAAQEEARASRLSMWRYGDILDASDDEE